LPFTNLAADRLSCILQFLPKRKLKHLLLETPLWQYAMSVKSLKDLECKKGMLTVWFPIPYVPPINLHEKKDTKQIKIKLPDGTNFHMSVFFAQGNKKEYLVHIIAVKHLREQKEIVEDVKKAYEMVLAIKKQLEPL
jgi:hypothetical protein